MKPTSRDLEEFESPEDHAAQVPQARADLVKQQQASARQTEIDAARHEEYKRIMAENPPDPADVTQHPLWMVLKIFPHGFYVDTTGRVFSHPHDGQQHFHQDNKSQTYRASLVISPLYVRCPPG